MNDRYQIAVSLIALALAALAAPAIAQDADEFEGVESEGEEPEFEVFTDEIIVTGEGLDPPPSIGAYATTEIDRETIVSSGSGRIEDVLLNVAGFQQFRRSDSRSANPSAQGVTLRALGGNATSRALVLLDGVPVADPFFGYIPLSAIAPETLSVIRVTRGGGSGPFGAGALAGTIELTSANVDTLGPVTASALVNDRGETEASGALAQDLGAGFAVVSGRWDRGKGFDTTPAEARVPASARAAFDSWSVGLRAVAPLTDTVELQARGMVFDDARTLRFDGATSTSEGQDASLRLVGRGSLPFDAIGYIQARNFSNVVVSSTRFVPVLDQRNTPSTGLGGKLELRPAIAEGHTLRIGVDYRRAEGQLQEDAISAFTGAVTERRRAGGSTSNLGVFVEDDYLIGPILLTAGLRADYTRIADGFFRAVDPAGAVVSELNAPDRSDWDFNWRAGARVNASRRVELRAAAYSGIRLPTLNELYRPFVVFPVVTQANAALENERIEGYEIGLDWLPVNDLRVSLTAFDNSVKNAIANVTITPNLRQRQNLPAIDAQGIEAEVGFVAGAIRFDASLAYTDATIAGEGLAFDGNRPAQTPDLSASATLAWQPSAGWRLAVTLRHVAAQFEDDLETDRLPPATTLDLFVQAALTDRVSVVLRGENLLDEEIVTRNAGGGIDLGVPRTLWVGLRLGY
jgi:outer membrane receptor protein involved in Fe transport